MKSRFSSPIVLSLVLVASGASGAAPAEAPVWSAQSKAGLILSAGNAQSASISGGVNASWTAGQNKVSGEATVAYLRSTLLVATDGNANGVIDEGEILQVAQTTSQSWLLKLRYDRIFAEANSAFLSASAASDVAAGKQLIGGGQAGYARRLFKTERDEASVEAGYDFQYEKYSAVEQPASIHSARVAAKNTLQLGEKGAFTVDAEALLNLNRETAPNPAGGTVVEALQDLRINATAAITSPITERLSVGVSFKLKYDRVPAPRPPFALPYAPGFLPFADPVDAVAEASLLYTLL